MTGDIRFDGVWKRFRRGSRHDSFGEVVSSFLRRATGREHPNDVLQREEFWAVQDVTFRVEPGRALGIIGPNGAGKTTILKLLTKVIEPTRGSCSIPPRTGVLIELEAGFHGDLTGRENMFLRGAILGMRPREVRRRLDDIIDFAGVSEFIDTPVKRYSSGMVARLGFSLAVHLEHTALVIDEVLSVGDAEFQKRAYSAIEATVRRGIPVVLVSHQLDRIAQLCTDAILLKRGQVACRGTPQACISNYLMTAMPSTNGTDCRIALVSEDGLTVDAGDHVRVTVDCFSFSPRRVRFGVQVSDLASGHAVFEADNLLETMIGEDDRGVRLAVDLRANLPAAPHVAEIVMIDPEKSTILASSPPVLMDVREVHAWRGDSYLSPRPSILEVQPAHAGAALRT